MIYKVVKYGDPILRRKLKPTDFETLRPLLPQLLNDMEETCLAAAFQNRSVLICGAKSGRRI